MTLCCKIRQTLLQNATAVLLQNSEKGFYKLCQMFYYKMRHLYYKIRRLLQNVSIQTYKSLGEALFVRKILCVLDVKLNKSKEIDRRGM